MNHDERLSGLRVSTIVVICILPNVEERVQLGENVLDECASIITPRFNLT